MGTIITFYIKAKAFKQTVWFFDACAQMEIDEYSNYAKALSAYNEALKYMCKMDNDIDRTKMETKLKKKIGYIHEFLDAKKFSNTNPIQTQKICHRLLRINDQDMVVQIGDCYGLLVNSYVIVQNVMEAFHLLSEMRSIGLTPEDFIEVDMLRVIKESEIVPKREETGNVTFEDTVVEENFL